ncbi:MAG: hypothetical protein COX19_03485 [Desulfobacterales bacterium CG23_combo_of_CG06-09_8_20_14_all_51_8]|nr:MAG: hypothetical protein COX19_03485 [Desulfobacterales bacterium CG23_combo_of_CG06-09_8_20_14_all_51_8]
MKKKNLWVLAWVFWIAGFVCSAPLAICAEETAGLSSGQAIYVPAYSHIYTGSREMPFLLTVTLSIRNVDPTHSLKLTEVGCYGTEGALLKKYITTATTLKPLESLRYVVPEQDKTGGSGANFMVRWQSAHPMNPPIVESIMIGTQAQQGISFTSRGQVIVPSD